MNEIGKGGGKGQIHDVDNGTHERMLGAREAHAHTKDNDSYVYRAKSAEFIRILEKAVLALFDKSHKESRRRHTGDKVEIGNKRFVVHVPT